LNWFRAQSQLVAINRLPDSIIAFCGIRPTDCFGFSARGAAFLGASHPQASFRPPVLEDYMQRTAGMLLILVGLGWLASEIPATPNAEQPRTTSWRRTNDGWERAAWLYGEVSRRPPDLHPLVVGAAQLLFALAALVGLSPGPLRKQTVAETEGIATKRDILRFS
jgi:hypothetical protein